MQEACGKSRQPKGHMLDAGGTTPDGRGKRRMARGERQEARGYRRHARGTRSYVVGGKCAKHMHVSRHAADMSGHIVFFFKRLLICRAG
jgi:hypothetical protein